jgi:VanZ family protein
MHASTRLILAFVLLGLTPLFFFGGPNNYSSRSVSALWNLGHIVFFLALTVLFLKRRDLSAENWRSSIIIAIVIVLLGVLIEWLQAGFNRTPDLNDTIKNVTGVMIALFFILPIKTLLPKHPRLLLQSITILLIGIQIVPAIRAFADETIARSQFPVLSDFETPFEIDRWKGDSMTIDRRLQRSGKASMRVDLNTNQYSGIALVHFPENWKGYEQVEFSAYNPATEPLSITCRIHDTQHSMGVQAYSDRFNRGFVLDRGWNTISISLNDVKNAPKGRQMDMSRIHGLGIFATQLPHARTMYIDDVKLAN